MSDTTTEPATAPFTPEQLQRMRFELLQSALTGMASKAAAHMHPLLTEGQKKNPALAAAIMADRLARSALHVFTTPPRPKEGQDGQAKDGGSW